MLNGVTFVLFGAILLGPALGELSWELALYAVLSLTVVRMLPVAIAMLGTRARAPTLGFLGWFGPRGLASIVFAVIVIEESHLPHEHLIVLAIYLTVGLSVFAHGLTAAPLADRYARWYEQHPRDKAPPMESAPTEVTRARGPAAQRQRCDLVRAGRAAPIASDTSSSNPRPSRYGGDQPSGRTRGCRHRSSRSATLTMRARTPERPAARMIRSTCARYVRVLHGSVARCRSLRARSSSFVRPAARSSVLADGCRLERLVQPGHGARLRGRAPRDAPQVPQDGRPELSTSAACSRSAISRARRGSIAVRISGRSGSDRIMSGPSRQRQRRRPPRRAFRSRRRRSPLCSAADTSGQCRSSDRRSCRRGSRRRAPASRHLWSAGITYHGAHGVDVAVSASS